jgi:transcriptional regulator with XRE-family HTH domain
MRVTPNQYRNAIEKLGLSQVRAAAFLGISPRTSQGYALGEYPVPEAVAKLLRLMIKLGISPEDV